MAWHELALGYLKSFRPEQYRMCMWPGLLCSATLQGQSILYPDEGIAKDHGWRTIGLDHEISHFAPEFLLPGS